MEAICKDKYYLFFRYKAKNKKKEGFDKSLANRAHEFR